MVDTVRVLRVIEYTGTRDWIEKTLAHRQVKESHIIAYKGEIVGVMREGIIGETRELVSEVAPIPSKDFVLARINWWRSDLSYKAPEQLHDRIMECLDNLQSLVEGKEMSNG